MADCLMLKKSNCKNCYKCIRFCPVKSIRFSGNQAYIIGNECILCGHCFVVCPQDAKQIVDETEKARVLLQGGAPVYVSLAPSFIANYEGVGIGSMRTALKKLGFCDAEETAVGATIVKNEYERMIDEQESDVIISSCCHSVNLLIQKYFPKELPYLANVLSPMQAHCMDIKKRVPEAKTVFIGPCVAKKDEAQYYEGIVDAVLTFDELTKWLKDEGIELTPETDSDENSRARFFPTTGGILKTMKQDNPDYTYMAIDGVENCIQALKDIENGKVHKCFIEMSACSGSCVGGPVMEKFHRSPVKDYMAVSDFAGKNDFKVEQPDSRNDRQNSRIFIETSALKRYRRGWCRKRLYLPPKCGRPRFSRRFPARRKRRRRGGRTKFDWLMLYPCFSCKRKCRRGFCRNPPERPPAVLKIRRHALRRDSCFARIRRCPSA